jgi:hypothetical protein
VDIVEEWQGKRAAIREIKGMATLRATLTEKMKIERIEEIKCYRFFSEGGVIERLDFIPVENVLGFSHRVAYNGKLTKKFLGADFSICQRNALDMLDLVREAETFNT